MRRALTILPCILSLLLSSHQVMAERIVFMPQWYPQAQFAGYYMALEKGFYDAEGLDVEIRHMTNSSKISPMENLESGKVDITTYQLVNAVALRSEGTKIVNILQTSQNSGLCVAAHKHLKKLQDLNNISVGKWKVGFDPIITLICREYDLEVKWVPINGKTNLFVANALDATLCFSFNELVEIELGTGMMKSEKVLHLADYGYNFPEDGLYVQEKWFTNHREEVEKFAKASILGWRYARENPEETIEVVMRYIKEGNSRSNKVHQRKMLEEILRLQEDKESGKASFERISREDFKSLVHRCQRAGVVKSEVEYDKFIRQ